MSATIFTEDQLTVTYEVKLFSCATDTVFDTDDIDEVFIVFTKPDGTKLTKDADLVEDTENPGTFFIQYRNIPPDDSILDDTGGWSYAGAGDLIDGGHFVTSEKQRFWVIS